jgi:Holliday junction resolvase RusA-like endonuclease
MTTTPQFTTTFELKGNIPSKKNSKRWIQRGHRKFLVPSEDHEAWHEAAMWDIKAQGPLPETIEKAEVVITIYSENKRAGDLSNKAESVMDLLVDLEIIKDDNWFVVGDLHLKFGGVDKENPRAVIEIKGICLQK